MSDKSGTISALSIRFASSTVVAEEEYAVIVSSAIPEITTVRLYEETVVHAHEAHGHEFPAELPSVIAAVSKAVAEPTHVEQSYKNSYVFVDAETTNAGGDPLRVPVKIHSGTSGLVKTYFFATTENEPVIVYRKPDGSE